MHFGPRATRKRNRPCRFRSPSMRRLCTGSERFTCTFTAFVIVDSLVYCICPLSHCYECTCIYNARSHGRYQNNYWFAYLYICIRGKRNTEYQYCPPCKLDRPLIIISLNREAQSYMYNVLVLLLYGWPSIPSPIMTHYRWQGRERVLAPIGNDTHLISPLQNSPVLHVFNYHFSFHAKGLNTAAIFHDTAYRDVWGWGCRRTTRRHAHARFPAT